MKYKNKGVIKKLCLLLAFIMATSIFEIPVSAGTVNEATTVSQTATVSGDIIPVSDLVYSGEEQALIKNLSEKKYFYSLTENGKYSETVPTGKNAGSYKVYYKTVSDNSMPSKQLTVEIGQKLLTEDMVIIEQPEQQYTGNLIWITPVITDKTKYGKELILSSDYYLTGSWGGKEIGEYSFTVIAKGNYTGQVSKTWKIVEKKVEEDAPSEDPGQPDGPGVQEPDYDEVVIGGQITLIYTRFDQSLGIKKYRISGKKNKKIATVTRDGVLNPKRNGVVTINAYKRVKVKGKKCYVPVASYTVKVVVPEVVDEKIKLTPGQSISANSLITNIKELPSDNQTIKIRSSKPDVITYDEKTGMLVAGMEGKSVITITFVNHDKKKVKLKKKIKVKMT